jgi:ABC-2 type transport system permease protein
MARTASTRRISSAPSTLHARVADIVRHRELLLNLVRLELKAKYKASALGFAWSLLNPLMYLVVFYIAFDVVLGSGIPRFPLYLLSGLLVWNFFVAAITSGTSSVVAGAGLVKKVWFPREILPLASVGAALVHFFLQCIVLVVALVVVRHPVGWTEIAMLPLALFDLILLAAGLAVFLSAANVYLRDMAHFVELALMAWFWMTPIVYKFSQLTGAIGSAAIALLNPITPIVLTFQRALYGEFGNPPVLDPHLSAMWYLRNLVIVTAGTLLLAVFALRFFARVEGNLAEEL